MSDTARRHAATLLNWLDEPINRSNLQRARAAFDQLAAELAVTPALRDELAPVLVNVFLRTGFLKDYKSLSKFARRIKRPELLDEVDAVTRNELPDVWVLNALKNNDRDAALDCWFEHEEHERARLCAAALMAAFPGRTDVAVSARLSVVSHLIGRGGRRRYRRACAELKKLQRELERAEELATWPIVVEDVVARHGHRPALMDELAKAQIV